MADHCSNIAVAALEAADSHLKSHDYLRTIKQTVQEDYRSSLTHYANKYYEQLSSVE